MLTMGAITDGHFQLELRCEACHSKAFNDQSSMQTSCLDCHGEALSVAQDSHPAKKFNDPRNAQQREKIDARFCTACHQEHQQKATAKMGVTIAPDYCIFCHDDIATQRPSHTDSKFQNCADAGCHNYHDNRALYEDFLVEHSNDEWLDANWIHYAKKEIDPVAFNKTPTQPQIRGNTIIHASETLVCIQCHTTEKINKQDALLGVSQKCGVCHNIEYSTYELGKHGIRLKLGLPAINMAESAIKRNENDSPVSKWLAHSADLDEQTQGCESCHTIHRQNYIIEESPFKIGTRACLNCHQDQHSTAFLVSKHASIITCASCHMPIMQAAENLQPITDHNQNNNLEPNEKMIRSVCLDCHGLRFAINALADEKLIENNFQGLPTTQVPSIDWALKRKAKK